VAFLDVWPLFAQQTAPAQRVVSPTFYLFSRAAARLAGAGVNAGISADLELRDALWRRPDSVAAVRE
jgi:hypothetical protein